MVTSEIPHAPIEPQPSLSLVRRSPYEQIHELTTYLADLDSIATTLCKSTILPKAMQNPANLKLVLLQGLTMGFDVVQSIRASFVIEREGEPARVGYYVDSLVALVRSSPKCRFFRVLESTAEVCRVECARTDEPESMVHTFELTIEQARKAGLDKKWYRGRGGAWESEVKYAWQAMPADMLNARCCGRAVKRTFQDVCFGMATPDELEDIAAADRDRSIGGDISGFSAPPTPRASAPIVDAEIVQELPRDTTKQGDSTPAGFVATAAGKALDDLTSIIATLAKSEDDLDREMSTILAMLAKATTRADVERDVGPYVSAARLKVKETKDDAYANAVIAIVEPQLQRVWRKLAPSKGGRNA